jgi:hypothetical protein
VSRWVIPAARREARHAREPRVDDHADALDGERRLGDARREHHLARAGRRRRDGRVLLGRVERAVELADARAAGERPGA